ncbi:Cytochrome P450 [Cordyceps fumosorosea ARSEF 2679]|uniref:Cytochrome P450 n=1 Tax=Cordyceps fumosorosea (strain ARSEF 2679) TaxID=1081104 RepID=A0A167RPI7_CORFA|nr:Cytochrome P450 [Cordyceps fumosorosea ARSEF 2679]OAA58802.1 Cytochrome P450 [Cordyceps fumosorosea ARSEF 2679]
MLLASPLTVAVAVLLLAAVYLARCLRSPLARLPGPSISKFTSLWLKWNEINATRTVYIHALHRRYGPVVRVAPNEVAFTSWAAVKEIYCSGGSGYDKTEFYDMFTIYGRRTMFTTLNKADHAKRKRILADRYANTNILRSASMAGIQERSTKFVRRCASASGAADVFSSEVLTGLALHAYACDCITHHLFHPRGTDCLENENDENMMHQVASDDSLQSAPEPRSLHDPALTLADRLISHYAPTLHRLFGSVLYLFAKPRETPLADNYVLETSKSHDPATFTLMSRLEEKSAELEPIDMAAECLDHMAAGIDTTGDGLCFLLWELSQPRSLRVQERLAAELRANPAAPLDQLPYLDAVVCEGLRCYPPIPMSLPRYVPEGGRVVDGYWLQAGTIASCQAFSVHRINDDLFPEPDAFKPERWLEEEGDADRRRLLFAFANGGRGCIGKHLALAEMKTLLRDVYSSFTTLPDASMKEEAMEMSDQLISARPIGQRCLLHFRPRE